jgi:hypothetical protein
MKIFNITPYLIDIINNLCNLMTSLKEFLVTIVDELFALREVYAPQTAPAYDSESYTSEHNCYAYALRLVDHGWAIPGRLCEIESENLKQRNINSRFIDNAIQSDGLMRVREHGARRDEHIIAAFVMQGNDFHFYSYDVDGSWSSKYSHRPVSRAIGPIFDTASAADDKNFCGYYKVPKQGIKYFPRLKVVNTLRQLGLI